MCCTTVKEQHGHSVFYDVKIFVVEERIKGRKERNRKKERDIRKERHRREERDRRKKGDRRKETEGRTGTEGSKKTEERKHRRKKRNRRKERHRMKQRNTQKKNQQPQYRQIDGVIRIKSKSCRIPYLNTVLRLSFNLESLRQRQITRGVKIFSTAFSSL
jgi:hypothetical protein